MTEESVRNSVILLRKTQSSARLKAKEILGLVTGTPSGTPIPTVPKKA